MGTELLISTPINSRLIIVVRFLFPFDRAAMVDGFFEGPRYSGHSTHQTFITGLHSEQLQKGSPHSFKISCFYFPISLICFSLFFLLIILLMLINDNFIPTLTPSFLFYMQFAPAIWRSRLVKCLNLPQMCPERGTYLFSGEINSFSPGILSLPALSALFQGYSARIPPLQPDYHVLHQTGNSF